MLAIIMAPEKIYSVRGKIPKKDQKELQAYPPLLQKLLYYRGLKTGKAAEKFLKPDYDLDTHDPFLIKNMDKAVDRILQAIENNEHIVIYTDYDCDGIPAGVLLHDFFKKIEYVHFKNYIPHRHKEGYGLNIPAVGELAAEGAKLIITADVGIVDVKAVEEANRLGVDVIITDHHLPQDALPPAYAILNSKQTDDIYPFDMLCGAGVAFKLVQALIQKGSRSSGTFDWTIKDGWEKWLLDMAGLSTIADMVPLVNENRVLAYYGLKVLRKSRRPGLQQLCRKLRIDQRELTEDDIGFMIAPRINAASRMDKPEDAFRLLATTDVVEADMLSDHLNKINDERKGHVAAIVKEIKRKLKAQDEIKNVIVLGDPRWRPALLGLAANSIVDEYERPVFLWGREGGNVIKGSCRSDGNINVVSLMQSAKDCFIESGGHTLAGGFSVENEKVHYLEDGLLEAYQNTPVEDVEKELLVEEELSLDEANWDTYALVEQLAPFGIGNTKPLFLFKKVPIKAIRQFGKRREHLQMDFLRSDQSKISAIGFFTSTEQFAREIEKGTLIDLVGTLERSTYRKYPELRLRIVDIV